MSFDALEIREYKLKFIIWNYNKRQFCFYKFKKFYPLRYKT